MKIPEEKELYASISACQIEDELKYLHASPILYLASVYSADSFKFIGTQLNK